MSLPDHNQEHKIVSATLSYGVLEVVRQYPSNSKYGTGQPVPDRVVKEIYTSHDPIDGPIVLDSVIEGNHIPAAWSKEKIEFPLDE